MPRRATSTSLGLCGLLAFGTVSAQADDVNIFTSFSGTGVTVAQSISHSDVAPFKGWANLEVTNTGTESWGDLHFGIFDPIGGQDISNVSFIVDPGFEPFSNSHGPLTWTVDNTSVGATIDLFYASNPVLPGQTADFHVYTDNPDHLSFFGLIIYPTPVPEPGTVLLLGLGALMIRRWAR